MIVIAIDGPAASGKSSVAKRLAKRLAFSYVNSGSMYRAVTWEVLRQGLPPQQVDSVTAAVAGASVSCGFCENGDVFLSINGDQPQSGLREEEINRAVSAVSAVPAVRELVSGELRALARQRAVVMEGRDIGSTVFPETPYKFYLDASPEIRRKRRAAEGSSDPIEARDRMDSSRANAPLRRASDAFVVDTSHLSLDGVVEEILRVLQSSGLDQSTQ